MDTRYNHQHEQDTYKMWEDAGAFNPDSKSSISQQKFSIIMPPPNANDSLHVGHAMFLALQDALIRFHRMRGDDTLWLPGTDHAGIETQYVFEKKLKQQGQSRFNFDRNTLYKKIADYVAENSQVAIEQMRRLGASADWSRFVFMLDEKIVNQVLDTFTKLHEENLIYRDERLVNYCPNCGTSFSELEIDYQEQTSPLYYVKYFFAANQQPNNWPTNYLVVATTRPEPIFVDTHLAVNPNNAATKLLIGKQVLNPLTQQPMTIIADDFVDPEFGTGIVKLTPAHDANDFAVAQKHNLPIISAINTSGRITENGGKYAGLKVAQARQQIVADLQAAEAIEKIDQNYRHRLATCYRCGKTIEPLPYPQFFLKMKPLTKKVIDLLDKNEVQILGAGQEKILRHWLTNLRDWNISRQIVWGIRIPVWYLIDDTQLFTVGFIDKEGKYVSGSLDELLKQGHKLQTIKANLQNLSSNAQAKYLVSRTDPSTSDTIYLQETDTFDTWFSSGQWPVTTLKANSIADFNRFYPTTVMETGHDILMFWVMRMLMFGLYLTNKVPFKTVYLHGLVRDSKGQKMSKSKGNVVNPLAVIDQFGTDALRMSLIIRSTPGIDKAVGDSDFKAMRNLTNKIWNATRFILMNTNELPTKGSEDDSFLNKLNDVSLSITQQLQENRLGLAAETAYNEFWHWFCDIAIEQAKQKQISQLVLLRGLTTFLKLLHPFTPFVTEKCWQEVYPSLPKDWQENNLLITATWPS